MKVKPYVYVAGPYTKGDPAINTHCQCLIFDRLVRDNIVTPYIPLWSHYQHGVKPQPYQTWIRYDFEIIQSSLFDAILRCPAELPEMNYYQWDSSGADNEVQWFQDRNLPAIATEQSTNEAIEALYHAVRDGVVHVSQRLFLPQAQ